ncbi:MAG: acyl-CoA thioesterase [Burkholderiaceae bacterium]
MPSFSELLASPIRPAPELGTQGCVFEPAMTHDWTQGRGAFGGIQGAIAARAMRAAVGQTPALRALQMTFVAAVPAGPTRAEAWVIRQGRNITHVQCHLHAGDEVAGVLVGVYGASRPSVAVLPMPMPDDLRPIDTLKEVPFTSGRIPEFLQHYQQRWAGGAKMFSASPPRPTRMWARLREAVPGLTSIAPSDWLSPELREASLVALADLPPSPVLSMLDRAAPGASLTWLLEFPMDPMQFDPAQWVMIQTDSRYAGDGYNSQTARLWTETGQAVGVSHQTTAIFG